MEEILKTSENTMIDIFTDQLRVQRILKLTLKYKAEDTILCFLQNSFLGYFSLILSHQF